MTADDGLARWIGSGTCVVVQGHVINGGLVYVGELLPSLAGYGNDPCLINPTLPAQRCATESIDPGMSYPPDYNYLSAQCRDSYLRWLASGRSGTPPGFDYALLCLYGLERRLFLDGPKGVVSPAERQVIIHEVRRLQALRGEDSSFLRATDNLLAMEWLLHRRDQTPPECYTFPDRYCINAVQIKLAYYIARGKPIHAELAYQTLMVYGEASLHTSARRCREQFKLLFSLRFTRKYGDGIVLKRYKTVHNVVYHAANPALLDTLSFRVEGLSNPMYRMDLIHKLHSLADLCAWELDAYSRTIGRMPLNPHGLIPTALLPLELKRKSSGYGKLASLLSEQCNAELHWLPLDALYSCFDEQPPSRLKQREYAVLASLLESLGFGMAPDVRTHGVDFGTQDVIAVFRLKEDPSGPPSHRFRLMTTVLRLGAGLCHKRTNAHSGTRILDHLIEDDDDLNATEKTSLHAFLLWCLRTPQSNTGIKQRLTEVSTAEKDAIRNILVSVAYADGRIDPKEIRQLEKLYTTLGLDKQHVSRDLHTLAADSGPVTVGRRESEDSYTIPRPPASGAVGFQLNQDLIRIREEETRRVRGVLEEIFADEAGSHSDADIDGHSQSASVDALQALDAPHHNLFLRLVERDRWELETFDALCSELGLMTDGAMEVLNEWAFTHTNAPLLECGAHVFIDLDLVKELQDVR